MITIDNINKYLSEEVMEQCFKADEVLCIDKNNCGNGASTSFFKMRPQEGKVNILIAPNKEFLIGKQKKYLNNEIDTDNKIKFFYQESTDVSLDGADVLVFVADSFLAKENAVRRLEVDKLMIDEIHTVEKDSSFRPKLKLFVQKVRNIVTTEGVSISCISATPNIFSKVDVRINNVLMEDTVISYSKNRKEAVERIRGLIKDGAEVVIFTNDAKTVYKILTHKNFKRDKKQVHCNWMIGDSMMRNEAELVDITQDNDSNVSIVSSRGFEGMDLDYKKANVFFFEDRANEHESFFIANLFQAINRTRSGATYIEYCRQDTESVRNNLDVSALQSYIDNRDVSVEKKMSKGYDKGTSYKEFHKYVEFEERGESFVIKLDEVAINLHNESRLYDSRFTDILLDEDSPFQKFLEERKIVFNIINDNQKRITANPREEHKKFMLKHNELRIKELSLYDNRYFVKGESLEDKKRPDMSDEGYRKKYLKQLQKFLRRKNYDGNYKMTEAQSKVLDILSDEKKFFKLLGVTIRSYCKESIAKYGAVKSRPYRESMKREGVHTLGQWLLTFSNSRVNLSRKEVAHRDYNLAVHRGMSIIETVGAEVGIKVTELDIVSAFPRFLFAINGEILPNDFYGKDKVNKTKINKLMNDFYYRDGDKTPFKIQKHRSEKKLLQFFPQKVVRYMMDNHFNSGNRASLFNEIAYHEKVLLDELKDLLVKTENQGVIRRHDSLLLFNNTQCLGFVNDFIYKGQGGWFEYQETSVENQVWMSDSFKEMMEKQNQGNTGGMNLVA